MYKSETSEARSSLAKYCVGDGIDIGYGGDPINHMAITMDQPMSDHNPLCGISPQNLSGNASDLKWFRDGVLDYVYSSHVLEDFGIGETEKVLTEWFRVLKVGGLMVLFLPDQQRYLNFCYRNHQPVNGNHKIDHFGLSYLKDLIDKNFKDQVKIVFERDPFHLDSGDRGWYSFTLVLEKIK
jgi:DNA modification methylase